nr:uncharacterized protein LOC113703042 isoform X2 [Coffea arabica]
MLEDQVANLLQRYLGNYVRGLNKEALKISVWQGDVELTNMQLKPEALNALKLPIKVKAGFLGSVKLKVPWSKLGQDPVLVHLDRIFLLAEPSTQVESSSEDVVQEVKRNRIREMEMKLLESRKLQTEVNKSWLESLINTVIGNLKLSVSNIHIRYEDTESNPGHPFAAGVTLDKLLAVTVDDTGQETFATGGALERIQKSVELERLAVYLDSDVSPWHIDEPWEDLPPREWDQIFKFGTKEGKAAAVLPEEHSYILQPVTGNAKYSKQHASLPVNDGQPLQKAVVNLDDVTLSLSKSGYRDLLKLADNFAAFNQRLKYAHYRPSVAVKSDPRPWWKYAYKAVSDQLKKASGKLSWEQVLWYARLRKKYISLYAKLLRSDSDRVVIDDNEEIKELDRELDFDLVLQWRMLAHKFVAQSMDSAPYLRNQKSKKSWWPFGWTSNSVTDESEPGNLSEDDWQRLNNIIGYKEGDSDQLLEIHGRADLLHTSLEIHMKHNASRLADEKECLADLSCENLDCFVNLYSEAKVFDVRLGSYQLSSPNGLLAESATGHDSLVGAFRYKPFDSKVDWSLVAKASPCYVTYLKDSIDGIVNFFESNAAVSQTVALETAAAVQMTIDEVKRTAQQQVNRALKDQARFSLDLNIAAPKITIPTDFHPDDAHSTKLLLDLGNLVIRTQDGTESVPPEEMSMYLQFDLVLSDVSAFLVDGDYHWSQASPDRTVGSSKHSVINFLPIIDKCGVIVKLQQIRLENPLFPSTRLALRLPSLGFHFSPARYHRLMQVAKIFQGENKDNADFIRPWDQADFGGWLSILAWKGMGGREAIWQRKYLCIVGPFLYVLDNPNSRSYKQYMSLRGKQLHQVPADIAGNLEHVLAVCISGLSINKIVEDPNALVLRCDSEDTRRTWQSWLQGGIYRASRSAPITGVLETSSDSEDSEVERVDNQDLLDSSKMEKVFLIGVLDELKIRFNYNCQNDQNFLKVLLAEEKRLFEFRATGGRVELLVKDNDMFIGMVLKSLEVEDLICRKGRSQYCYLARSVIRSSDALSLSNVNGDGTFVSDDLSQGEGEDEFYEASETLNDESPQSWGTQPDYFSSQNFLSVDNTIRALSFSRLSGLLPANNSHPGDDNMEVNDTLDSFVKAQVIFYDKNSSLDEGVETKVAVSLATLSFFCRRPMILAIMNFVNAINVQDDSCESFRDTSAAMVQSDVSDKNAVDKQVSDVLEERVAQGFIGKGKSRVIFYLTLQMARAQILLMKENGSKLATLSQDNFLTDIKVFPSSFSIKASLGNLRISDDSLHSNHIYFWACDMRNPGGSSFVELVFCSFSPDDEDYEGYDYSLVGQLSEVRIVYLNRFLQEVISYFMGLVPSNSVDIVRVKDQKTNTEKSFTRSEIEGSPAVKFDLSLRKPIILMPRRTDSLDYLKLDIVHITVQNTFQWFHGSRQEMNAVHMEILTVKVEDINLNVGSGTELGESIMQNVNGISVIIRRSLRDLLHQIPDTEVDIKIEELKAALSNKEYRIISECAQSNFSETPNLVPQLNVSSSASVEVAGPSVPVDSNATESGTLGREKWISTKVSVIIDLVELSLYYGVTRDASLATLKVSGAWFLYKSNSSGEGFLSATLKDFTMLDDREGTEEELRLAIRKPETIGYNPTDFLTDEVVPHKMENKMGDIDRKPVPTMLVLDAKFSDYSTSLFLCIQRPQLLVALDFLLDVVEFFVPTVRGMLSNEEDKNASHIIDGIILDKSTFSQPSAEFSLSPLRPLVADDERFDLFLYDGRGGTLYLLDRQGSNLSSPSMEAIFCVGTGKKLQFTNVTIKNGQFLDSCMFLGSNSSYSATEDDNVFLDEGDSGHSQSYSGESSNSVSPQNVAGSRSTEIVFELQAIGPELTFYNMSKDVGKSLLLSNKLLHTQLDAFCRLVLKGDTIDITAEALGFTMESNGIRILEPFDTSMTYSNASGKTNMKLTISDIYMNFSFSILRLFLAVEDDILAFLRMSSKKMTVVCSEFDKIGTFKNPSNDQVYAFWRPRAPPGFAILGDYLTPLDKPPTKGVVAVNTSFVRVKRPESFKLVWPSTSMDSFLSEGVINGEDSSDGGKVCSIWFPEAPKGYLSMGCVVSSGRKEPPASSAHCILASLVSSCGLRDCINISLNSCYPNLVFWRVDNSVGTFLSADPTTMNLIGRAYELRHLVFGFPYISSQTLKSSDIQTLPSAREHTIRSERSSTVNSGRRFEAVATFRLIWWNQGSGSRKKLSIWRPTIPEGMVYFGDIAVKGYEPPNTCVVLHDSGEELYKPPLDFQRVGQIKKHRGVDNISLWLPQAPPGFVSLGCVACKGAAKLSDFSSLRCIRSDMVTGDQFLDESLWDTSDIKFVKEPFSIWTVGNDLGTFIVRGGFKKPPRRFALKLADPDIASCSDDTAIDAEIRTFSAVLFDDYTGLMVPLCNLSLSSIGFSLHGRQDFSTSCLSFSLTARSYNDKYEAWEPLIEPVDGSLRYQYNPNAPGAASQLRLTPTGDLNMNISVSNINMIFQAYASWNSLSQVHESYTEAISPKGGAIIDMHHRKSNYLIPQNKLGQDIFIRVADVKGLSNIIKMPSGERKPLKVPVSKNMLDSHLNGNLCQKLTQMVTIIIAEAELPKFESLSSNQYAVAVHLIPNQSQAGELQPNRQSARTCGTGSDSSSDVEIVKWNEVFFFKIVSTDCYMVEMIVTETGKGDEVGYFSSPLEQIATSQANYHFNSLAELTWLQLSSAAPKVGETLKKTFGRIRCSVLLSPKSEVKYGEKSLTGDRRSGFIEISPTRGGPWTIVRLNYAAPAACWQFGNSLVASEVSVNDSNRYVIIRSMVSVRNDTDIVLDLCLKLSASSQKNMPGEDEKMVVTRERNQFVTDEFFENEQYNPAVGWVENLDSLEGALGDELPSGWEWIDEWHVDKSSVQTADGWVYAPNFQHLKWPESYNPLKSVNYARQRRWIRHRKCISGDFMSQISVGIIRPGEVVSVPLSGLTQSASYILQLRPLDIENSRDYAWSSVMDRPSQLKDVGTPKENSEICVSTLKETEKLLHCPEISGTSFNGSHSIWFCLKILGTEIAKDKNSYPIKDWSIVVKSPVSITNYLPLSAEFSVLEMQSSGHCLNCYRGVFKPGETVKIYNVDIRNPLYLSLLPQKGWLPMQEAVLISHPSREPSKTISLRSSLSGRTVQLILEQNDTEEGLVQSKVIKVYSPCWLAIAGCPPLTFRLVNFGGKSPSRKIPFPFKSKKSSEVILEEITDEELCEGHTIASALNFKLLGLSASASQSGEEHFGPVKDLSPLNDMDGSVDLCAYNSDGNCMRLFISSKPCTFLSIPTKVIFIRPYITFTNRLGQNIFIKLSSEDEPKILHATDERVSFVYREAGRPMELQVRLDDTNWSFPFQVAEEDTISLVMRKGDGTCRFLRTEIRGYEEGSRFIVVFRCGSLNGPIRVENRTRRKMMRIHQSGFGDDAWIQLCPLSTSNFSWENPYGEKFIDAEIQEGNSTTVRKFNLEKSGLNTEGDGLGLLFHVLDLGDLKVARFLDEMTLSLSREGSRSAIHVESLGNSHIESNMQDHASPLELIVEMQAVGVSVVDHTPKELSYLYLERVFISYSTGYDGGTTSRFKLILGYLQLDNQLPLTLMPVLLAPEQTSDASHPVFKMTVTVSNKSQNGIQIYPYVYIRVTDKCWRLNIHEPIIWAYIGFYSSLQLDRVNQSSSVTQVDPEIRIDLIDISEVRLKVSLETSPAERPPGVLGVWSPILTAVGNAFKIQIHLRKLIRRGRFMRKSSVVSAITNRLWRDLIHNPLHLIFSVDVLGMTSSTLASLSKGFAELSTDGQFLQLRSKQVWSRRIGGVGDGIIQGTEALAQGVAFGVSGVLRKPVESARENGLLGLAHGLGQAFLGFIVQPVSGALDFVSLTVDGIGASCSRCLDILQNKTSFQRIRNPRAIHSDNVLREYCRREAVGQMVLFLAEASRHFGCTEIFKEPSKFAWSDQYEAHFVVPYQRIVLVTNKRVMLLQCASPDKMDKKPCKIMWDVPWEDILALELAKAGFPIPSHLIIHLKNFKRSENFVRVIKCNTEESNEREPQAVSICSMVRKFWKRTDSEPSNQMSKVPSIQRHVCSIRNEAGGSDPHMHLKSVIKSTELSLAGSASDDGKLVTHCMNFLKVWSSEQESKGRCTLCQKKESEEGGICSIWRPVCPNGYISVGDIARAGSHPPNVSAVYHYSDKHFTLPVGFDLVWRNCLEDYITPVSIWHPRAPAGYVSPGCVAVPRFEEPDPKAVYCIAESLAEETVLEDQKIWSAPDSYPWSCHIYQVQSGALHFVALRQPKEESDWKSMRVVDDL